MKDDPMGDFDGDDLFLAGEAHLSRQCRVMGKVYVAVADWNVDVFCAPIRVALCPL